MSAYINAKEHIDALLRVAVLGPLDRGPSYPGDGWRFDSYYHDGKRQDVTLADGTGAMLVAENAASVRYRYHDEPLDDLPGPLDKDFVKLALVGKYDYSSAGRRLTIGEALLALDGYEYQSCEHPDWQTSEARSFCDALRSALIHELPEYKAAETWEVTA